jgi:hypothetical protein
VTGPKLQRRDDRRAALVTVTGHVFHNADEPLGYWRAGEANHPDHDDGEDTP